MTKVIKLIPGDIGWPITDRSSSLLYPGLAEDVREVLRTLAFAEREIATRDGRWFIVRTMAYRTIENMIDGVVITFTDITISRTLETKPGTPWRSIRPLSRGSGRVSSFRTREATSRS